MAEKKLRTQWSKEPDEEPDYSDWKITLAMKKASDDPAAKPLTRSSSSKPKTKKNPPSSTSSVTFLVHRNIIGPQSEYFNRMFKSNDGGFSEARQQHSHIDFPSTISVKSFNLIVEAFEALLKYCYLENVDLEGISPVPLLYFCDYFQMEDDFEVRVEEYSEQYFYEMASKDTLHFSYEQIIDFRTAGLNVERAQTITSEICHNDMYDLLSDGGPMAIIADLPLWLNIVSFIQEHGYDTGPWKYYQTKSQSGIWSMNIANFLENNDNSSAVDSNSFQKLTNKETLPYVDVHAALVFLKEEHKYATPGVSIDDDDDDDDDNNDKEEELSLLTNLQHRCVEGLVEAHLERSHNEKLRGRAMKVMILLPNRVMGIYLNKTLNCIEKQVQKLEREKARDRDKHDAKRRKLEQDNTVRLKNVEQELETEKEKYRRLVGRMNRLKGSPFGHNDKSRIQL